MCSLNMFNFKPENLKYFIADFHRSAPFVITSSVDQTAKVWECR